MRRSTRVPPSELAESAACVVTSPPYNVGLGYDSDHEGDVLAWDAYWRLADAAADMMARALLPGGRCGSTPRCRSPRSRARPGPTPAGPGSGGCCWLGAGLTP